MSDDVTEFDCTECKCHIVQICGTANQFHLCALCLCMPGWYNIPELKNRLDLDWESECADAVENYALTRSKS